MKIVKSLRSMSALIRHWREAGEKIVLIPTMGALHEGHLSLIKRGRRLGDRLVVSIFVNPAQFGPREDFSRYPLTSAADQKKCRTAGVDAVFCPTAAALYPAGFDTWTSADLLASTLEGAARPTHFRGVCTVVLKLFNIIRPQVAIFGQKDYQQSLIIRRMVSDLNLPVKIVIGPTVREPDGLALSSRNAYLTPAQHATAGVLYQVLCRGRDEIKKGKNRPTVLASQLIKIIERESKFKVEYLEFADLQTLKKVTTIQPPTIILLAARLGRTRFIDNLIVK